MSLTGFYFTPYLYVNPQCQYQTTKSREGNCTRQMVKDCYKLPDQEFWDKGKGLPPNQKKSQKEDVKCVANKLIYFFKFIF